VTARLRTAAPLLLGLAVVAGAWATVAGQATTVAPGPVAAAERTAAFLRALAGDGTVTPAYADAGRWAAMAGRAVETVVMSVAAVGIAGLIALLTIAPASRVLTVGSLAARGGLAGRLVFLLTRGLHVLARAVPEVVWALLVVFVVRPGLVAGALALALHELGVLGRLGADVIDDLDRGPLESLRSAGAGAVATVAYGVVPQALPQLVTFLLYRWEIVIRASVVVGFITSAGLGHELRLALSFRRFTDLALVLIVSVGLVWLVELVATGLRRLAR
jgi:phosphonate transport system permease protein